MVMIKCPKCSGRMFVEEYKEACNQCRTTGATVCGNCRILQELSCINCGNTVKGKTLRRGDVYGS